MKTFDDVEKIMTSIFNDCHSLRAAGQKEYAGGEDALGNFNRLAKELDSSPSKVLWVYAMKHKDGIAAYIRGHKSQREGVRGRIRDLIVYLVLLEAIFDEEDQITSNFDPRVLASRPMHAEPYGINPQSSVRYEDNIRMNEKTGG